MGLLLQLADALVLTRPTILNEEVKVKSEVIKEEVCPAVVENVKKKRNGV